MSNNNLFDFIPNELGDVCVCVWVCESNYAWKYAILLQVKSNDFNFIVTTFCGYTSAKFIVHSKFFSFIGYSITIWIFIDVMFCKKKLTSIYLHQNISISSVRKLVTCHWQVLSEFTIDTFQFFNDINWYVQYKIANWQNR